MLISKSYLRRREQRQPLGIDNGPESLNKCGSLLFNLRVHTKVRHQVNVIYFVFISNRLSASTRNQLVSYQFSECILVEGESKLELPDIAFVVFDESKTAIKISIE